MFGKLRFFTFLAILVASVLILTSCSKESLIVGKWRIAKASINGIELSADKGETWTFKEKGVFSGVVQGIDVNGTWNVSRDNLTINFEMVGGTKVSGVFAIGELRSKTMSLSGNWLYKYEDGSSKLKINYVFDKY